MRGKSDMIPVRVQDYQIEDAFWTPRIDLVQKQMLPYQWKVLHDEMEGVALSHCVENFKIAAGEKSGEFEGCVFQDSDAAKWLEAVGYVLAGREDEELEKSADQLIDLIARAQQPDGYLDTYYIINGLDKRWTDLMNNHELYCAGHMIEAGVAYYEGTGKRTLLDVVIRLADCIDRTFGPEEGKLHGYPGHEIIEMALVRLYRLTGEERYLHLAKYFIDERGKAPNYFETEYQKYGNEYYWEQGALGMKYFQADVPVREQTEAEGHAVRAVYLYSGMAAVAKETKDEGLWEACRTLWDNIAHRQMYITGAIGSSGYGEAFTFDYDLPNDTVYGETCASVGLVFLARRMLEMEEKREYADVMERALFNTCLAGMSVDGTKFFYVNPLEVDPKACRMDQRKRHVAPSRRGWFTCACCPPNLARLLASIGTYAVTVEEGRMHFHLYIGGTVTNHLDGAAFQVKSTLPWNGDVEITYCGKEPKEEILHLRIPGWASGTEIRVNGQETRQESENGYVMISRTWEPGDRVKLSFGMKPVLNHCNPKVKENIGKAAVSRGPVVYCAEEKDNGDKLHQLIIGGQMTLTDDPDFDGAVDILVDGSRVDDSKWEDTLYASGVEEMRQPATIKLVPYYLWNNRGEGEMAVWMREK